MGFDDVISARNRPCGQSGESELWHTRTHFALLLRGIKRVSNLSGPPGALLSIASNTGGTDPELRPRRGGGLYSIRSDPNLACTRRRPEWLTRGLRNTARPTADAYVPGTYQGRRGPKERSGIVEILARSGFTPPRAATRDADRRAY